MEFFLGRSRLFWGRLDKRKKREKEFESVGGKVLGAKLIILLLSLSLWAHASGEACAPVVVPGAAVAEAKSAAPKSARVRPVAMNIYSETAVLEILKMYGQLRNLNEGFNTKKKEMILGRELGNGYSLEMNYEYDGRDDVRAYNYLGLTLIHPDGFKEVISKRPVNPKTWTFFEEYYDFDGPVGQFDLVVPMKIEGPTLTEIEKWGKRLDFLDASDLRKLKDMSDLKWLYLKYFKEDQKDLYKNRSRKEYSKIIFSVALIFIVNYFTFSKKKDDKDLDSNHADLFDLLLNFEGPRVFGLVETEKKQSELETLGGAPTLVKSFVDREPPAGLNRIVTLLEYSKLGMILVTEYVFSEGRPVEANGLIVRKGDKTFTLLSRALRAE